MHFFRQAFFHGLCLAGPSYKSNPTFFRATICLRICTLAGVSTFAITTFPPGGRAHCSVRRRMAKEWWTEEWRRQRFSPIPVSKIPVSNLFLLGDSIVEHSEHAMAHGLAELARRLMASVAGKTGNGRCRPAGDEQSARRVEV